MPDRPDPTPALPDDRRAALLQAAMGVFIRYGYKKASMDEVARAAGLSRQGLYLHFPSKDALFREVVAHVLDSSLGAGRAALRDRTRPLEDRLVSAFDAVYGQHVGGLSATPHLGELLEASQQLVGTLVQDQEQAFRDAVAQALSEGGARPAAGLPARDVAEMLVDVAYGLKHRASSRDDFALRFRPAVRLVCSYR